MQSKNKITVYCTIFDNNYFARALALYESLMRVNQHALFAFFCIDEYSARLLSRLALKRALVVRHDEFATHELLQVKPLRSRGEYCWTCKPVALLYLMRHVPEAQWVIYVDADMMFFADPDAALPGPDVHYLLTPHRFHSAFSSHEKSAGKHNAGYVAARCSDKGREVIGWWQDRCLESCSFIPTESTFADQKYLDQMAGLFPCGESSQHKGLNAAPWNIENYRVQVVEHQVNLDDDPLLLYHFQGLHLFANETASLYVGNWRLSRKIREAIYRPHLDELIRAFKTLRVLDKEFKHGLGSSRKYLGSVVTRILKILRRKSNVVPFVLE